MIDLTSALFQVLTLLWIYIYTVRTYLCHPLGNGSVSDDSSEQYQNGGYIPQHDGASDAMPQVRL